MDSRYILRGKILAAQLPASFQEEFVDLLAVLDGDASLAATDELAKVRRMYALEARKRGREMIWISEEEPLLPPRVESKHLLFTLPGIQVFELPQKVLAW